MKRSTAWCLYLLCAVSCLLLRVPAGFAETLTYSYDTLHRLTKVVQGDGSSTDYVYDNVGNRVIKRTNVPGAPADTAPNKASNPQPGNGAVKSSITPTLTWSATDPDAGDKVVSFLYFGTTTNPPLVASGSITSFSPGALNFNTTYYWRVDTRDSRNLTTTGTLWSFTQLQPPPTPTKIAAGAYHTVVLKGNGNVQCFGHNGYGQLGDGSTTSRSAPVTVSGLSGITSIAAGAYHTLALKSDGTVWAWGNNGNGQLGDGSTTQRTTPVQVTGLTGVTAIAAGATHSLALKSDGTVWAWGYNNAG